MARIRADQLETLHDVVAMLELRIGIETEERVIPHDDASRYTFAIHNWLGELQYSLVRAVDR